MVSMSSATLSEGLPRRSGVPSGPLLSVLTPSDGAVDGGGMGQLWAWGHAAKEREMRSQRIGFDPGRSPSSSLWQRCGRGGTGGFPPPNVPERGRDGLQGRRRDLAVGLRAKLRLHCRSRTGDAKTEHDCLLFIVGRATCLDGDLLHEFELRHTWKTSYIYSACFPSHPTYFNSLKLS